MPRLVGMTAASLRASVELRAKLLDLTAPRGPNVLPVYLELAYDPPTLSDALLALNTIPDPKLRILACMPEASLTIPKDSCDWVLIIGPDQPMMFDWVKSILDSAKAVGVPVWFDSWGVWTPMCDYSFVRLGRDERFDAAMFYPDGKNSDEVPREDRRDYAQKVGLPMTFYKTGFDDTATTVQDKSYREIPVLPVKGESHGGVQLLPESPLGQADHAKDA